MHLYVWYVCLHILEFQNSIFLEINDKEKKIGSVFSKKIRSQSESKRTTRYGGIQTFKNKIGNVQKLQKIAYYRRNIIRM